MQIKGSKYTIFGTHQPPTEEPGGSRNTPGAIGGGRGHLNTNRG
jgi:hypothetical protein